MPSCWWCRRRRARGRQGARAGARAGTPVIACAKGIERGTHKFMTEVIAECAPNALPAILSGPSFAADVARGLPTAVTLAAADDAVAAALAQAIGSAHVPALSLDRRARRRDRRRRQECAGYRRRHRRGPRAWRQRRGGADHARLCRVVPLRPRLRRAARNPDRPVRPRRPDPDLLEPAVAQLLARRRARARATAAGAAHGKLAEGAFTAPVLLEMAREKDVEMPIAQRVAAMLDGDLMSTTAIECC